jgi:hypothetical protein
MSQVQGLGQRPTAPILRYFTLPLKNVEKQCLFFVYYEEIKWELKRILIYEWRCNERRKAKTEGSKRSTMNCLRTGQLKLETIEIYNWLNFGLKKKYKRPDLPNIDIAKADWEIHGNDRNTTVHRRREGDTVTLRTLLSTELSTAGERAMQWRLERCCLRQVRSPEGSTRLA